MFVNFSILFSNLLIYRFFAIIHPFRSFLWLERHKISAIVAIWSFGSLIASPQLFYNDSIMFQYRGERFVDCREKFTAEGGKIYTIFIFLFTFFIPILALMFVYIKICLHLMRNSSTPGNPNENRDKVCLSRKIKVNAKKIWFYLNCRAGNGKDSLVSVFFSFSLFQIL